MKYATPVFCVLAAVAAQGQESPGPEEILRSAEAALRGLDALAYEVRSEASGSLQGQFPTGTAKVLMARRTGAALPKLRVDARLQPPNGAEQVNVVVATDGEQLWIVDHARKVRVWEEVTARTGSMAIMIGAAVPELFAEKPFEAGLPQPLTNATGGREKIGDVECDIVKTTFAAGEVRWWFATRDHLPRRIERHFTRPAGPAVLTLTLSSLEPRPAVSDDAFRLVTPEGYAEEGLLSPGTPAPDWTLRTGDDQETSLKSLRGKVVLLDFWATWCRPCIMSMPHVQKLHEKYRDRPVAVLAVNCFQERDPRADPVAFVKERGCTYPVLLKGDEVARVYRIEGIPAMVLIGPDGRVLFARAGLAPEGDRRLEQEIERALSATSQPAQATQAAVETQPR
ncbi:MAG: redoxin domain-containing protein [Planctomycetota bacterium]